MTENNNNNTKVVLFAHDFVGEQTLKYVFNNYREDISLVILIDENLDDNTIYKFLLRENFPIKRILAYDKNIYKKLLKKYSKQNIEYFLLLWWPKIIPEQIINIPLKGTINLHPSYLPFCKGKDPNFWTLIEQAIFGVTIHKVQPGIDDGPIMFQKKIDVNWEDDGKTLYDKSVAEMIKLFKDSYPKIRKDKFSLSPQEHNEGSFHFRKELVPASEIKLNQSYLAKDLINKLRARTFVGHPSCWFIDDEIKYEIRVEIEKVLE